MCIGFELTCVDAYAAEVVVVLRFVPPPVSVTEYKPTELIIIFST